MTTKPKKPAQTGTDWTPIRLAYIHSGRTLAHVAAEFGVTKEATEKRAEREGWSALRREASEAVSRATAEQMEAKRSEELAAWNEADIKVARVLRGQVIASINSAAQNADPLTPVQIRALVGAAEGVQRIGRLALGATTDNTGLSDPTGGPIAVADVPLEEYQAALQRILGGI